jgi:hypothetical protein
MRREQASNVLARVGMVSAIVGIVFAVHGTITERATTYRTGTIALLVGLGVAVDARSRLNTQRLMEHQSRTAALTMRERQQYAEMGYKAARLDALSEDAPPIAGDAQIVNLPFARSSSDARKKGSAS